MEKLDIYGYNKRLEHDAKRIIKLTKHEKKELKEFYKFLKGKGRAPGRILKYLYTIRALSKMLGKPFKKATKKDFIDLVGKLENGGKTPALVDYHTHPYGSWSDKDLECSGLKSFMAQLLYRADKDEFEAINNNGDPIPVLTDV